MLRGRDGAACVGGFASGTLLIYSSNSRQFSVFCKCRIFFVCYFLPYGARFRFVLITFDYIVHFGNVAHFAYRIYRLYQQFWRAGTAISKIQELSKTNAKNDLFEALPMNSPKYHVCACRRLARRETER